MYMCCVYPHRMERMGNSISSNTPNSRSVQPKGLSLPLETSVLTTIQGPVCCNLETSITGYGNPHAEVMAIGIAPGKHEALTSKRPLTGPSGKLFDALLRDVANVQREDVYCTNTICWWNDKPTRAEILVCQPRLLKEIELVNPRVVLLLGKIACESLLNIPFSKARGALIRHNGRLVLVSNHPAAAYYSDNKEDQINSAYNLIRDIAKLRELPTGDDARWHDIGYELVTTCERAQDIMNHNFEPNQVVSLDIETVYDKEVDQFHPFSSEITCIGIGTSSTFCYVLTPPAFNHVTWRTDLRYLYHNGVYDTQQIAKYLGVWLPISEDTLLQSYTIDERNVRGLHKLKHLAREYVGSDFYEEDEHHIHPDDQESYNRMYSYNAKDVCYTYRLHQYLSTRQVEENTHDVYESVLLPAQEMLARAQYKGIYINPANVEHIEATFGIEYIKLDLALKKLAASLGFPDLNLRSPIQLKAMLNAQGHDVANTNKYTMQDLVDTDNEFVAKLMRHRTLANLITKYLHQVLEQIKTDGRVHPHAFLFGTVTGRLTYKDPVMNTLPKPKTVKDLGIIRSIFSATNSDYILLEIDYAQIEAWLGAYFSQDPTLLADLQSGNWHTHTTEDVFKVKKQDVTPFQWAFYYDGGKHLNYGCMFGEGPEGLTRKPPIGMGCDIQTAREYHKRWYARYHVYANYQRSQKRKARDSAELVTPFGRKRRFPIIVNDHQERQAINYEIQSTASDYTITSAIKLWPQLEKLDTHLLFCEHDALYYEVNKAHLGEVAQLIKSTMEQPPLPGLPSIKTEIDIGPNLAELEHYNV